MTKLQQLTERIQTLLPEIMELKFNQRAIQKHTNEEFFWNSHSWQHIKNYNIKIKLEDWKGEILGRDINLEDVLKVLGGIEDYWTSFLWTGDRYAFTIDRAKNNKVLWQLGKPLHLQSEETINFLWDLLCNNNSK